jgi:uncharacterized protein DUF2630
MDDDVLDQISKMVEEEHQLRARAVEELSPDDHDRIQDIEVRLDQCWDLLRQRRAKRDAGQSPADAHVRNPDTVEHYQQ